MKSSVGFCVQVMLEVVSVIFYGVIMNAMFCMVDIFGNTKFLF